MRLLLYMFVTMCTLRPPPIGAKYYKTLKFPMIGHQSVALYIASRDRASIELDGIATHKEFLEYAMNPTTNEVIFKLSGAILSRLQRYHVKIQRAWYDETRDEACITLRINLIPLQKNIRMPRVLTKYAKKNWSMRLLSGFKQSFGSC